MRSGLKILGWALAALMVSPLTAQQTGFDASFKGRLGVGLAGKKDGLAQHGLGFGFEAGYSQGPNRVFCEVGYQYVPGNEYLTNVATMPVAMGAIVDATASVDSRKNQLGGVAFRLGFERTLGSGPWSLQVGIQGGGTQFRQEYIGDVRGTISTSGLNTATYEDTYNGISTLSKTRISPFIGARYRVDSSQYVEVNVLSLAYTSANYVHVAGTVKDMKGGHTSWDTVQTRNQTRPTLELAYGIRF